MIKTYMKTISILVLCGSLLLGFLGWISNEYTRSIDRKTLAQVLQSPSNLVVPSVGGTGMGLDAINGLTNLKTSGKLITFGTSITLAGLVDNALDYPHLNAAVGSMSIQDLFVMKSYLTLIGTTINADDIVKIDLGPTMFTHKPLATEVLVSALRYADIYRVDADYSVHRNLLGFLGSFYALNGKHIEKALTELTTLITKGSTDPLYATALINFDQYHKFLDFSSNNTLLVKAFIDSFKGKQVVIDLMFMTPALRASQTGILFDAYVDQQLIPYLVAQGIPYLDHRTLYTTADFADSTHLNGPARLDYTRRINTELKGLFNHD